MSEVLRLKKGEERRLMAGHLWVFSNEVDTSQTPLKLFEPGQTVEIRSARDDLVGTGYVNPHSLIAARICSRGSDAMSANWFRSRLQRALALREQTYNEPFYRLVHGEGDFMPGLVIDRFDRILIVQITTAGMERCKELLVTQLQQLLSPKVVMLRNDSAIRDLEQLERYQQLASGEPIDDFSVLENDLEYRVSASDGQKTGWFYDHRSNRALLAPYVRNARVLDCFCYAGAWGLNALKMGASSAIGVDSSQLALTAARRNAALNNMSERYQTLCGEAKNVLRELIEAKEKFDVVIMDPPAFIKRKKDYRAGLNHYALHSRLATQLLSPGGVLVSASCSQPLQPADLSQAMLKAVRKQGFELQLLHELHQSVDHPVNAAMSETRYLKGFIGRLS